LVIHRHHLVIVEVSLSPFISHFSDGVNVLCLEIFYNLVVVFLVYCFVAFAAPNRGFVIVGPTFRTSIAAFILFLIRVSKKFRGITLFQLL
jgi:hypothetical protein